MRPFVSIGKLPLQLDNQYLVEGVLPSQGVAMLYGPTQQHKSFVGVDLAARIATGLPWAERVVEQGRVCYLAAEDEPGVLARLHAWAKSNGVDVAALDVMLSGGQLDLLDDSSVDALINLLRQSAPVRAVFIDTLSRSFGDGDDMDRRDIYRAIQAAERIAEALSCCVVLVYHTARPNGNVRIEQLFPKGGSPWEQGIGYLIASFKNELLIRKVKNGRDGFKLPFSTEIVDLGRDSKGRLVTSLALTVGVEEQRAASSAARATRSVARPTKGSTRADGLCKLVREWEARRGEPMPIDAARKAFAQLPEFIQGGQAVPRDTVKSAFKAARDIGVAGSRLIEVMGMLSTAGARSCGALSERGDLGESGDFSSFSPISPGGEVGETVNTPLGVCSPFTLSALSPQP